MTAQVIPFRERSRTSARGSTTHRGPRILPLILFVAAVVAVFFSMIFLRISLDETAFELSRLQSDIEIEQSRQLDLRYDLAGLQDPRRIATEAERIGLVHPDERVAIVVVMSQTPSQVVAPESPLRALDDARP